MTYLGNSINIAGKNRFLTSNLMFSTAEYFIENSSSSDTSNINTAINELESNILTLKHGGKISDIDLKPLPSEFSKDWDSIHQKWIFLKTILSNNILKQNQIISPVVVGEVISEATTISSSTTSLSSEIEIDKILKTILETGALPLITSSDILVTKLGEHSKDRSQYSILLYILFAILNIGVTAAFVLYLVRKILKPILVLTIATSEVKRGNLNVVIKNKGNGDELSVLTESFNSMVTSIKNYINKQNELKKELEKANEELKYRDQLKDEFINVAAHELKTPIQPILGLCEVLRDRETNIEKDEEILDIIIRNSKRLLKLAEDILNVARIESGSFFLKKEKFDLKKMITEILRDFEQKIVESKKNIKLAYEFYHNNNNDEIIVEADRNRLSQVVYNLLNNAFNFTNEGSITVIVDGRKKDDINDNDEILVSIKDTGTGIHQEILPNLFTKFATKSSMTSGTGLGLFISKKIIEMHGGRIYAINNNIDDDGREVRGSTFTFSLPINNT
ncbi:MAG TPA: HAMP domain-containing sensor histidine kinase [Nitrososphaeraceae archaeon]|nr:HAMP domain-containing sensor histidine kinase [Nitrososphaeraceae archaeon]